MPSPSRTGRARLRVAAAPTPPPPPAPSRLALWARAAAAGLLLLWLDVVALAGMARALAPLLFRRAPLGHRLRPRRREARVIPLLASRRRATQSR